jgi:peptide/nickel transport system permease protein
MWAFLRRRLLYSLIALVGVTMVVFALARLNGSPALLYLPEGSTQQAIALFNHQHGYDQPLWTQFWNFLADAGHLDFGQSLAEGQPATTTVLQALPQTLQLLGLSMLTALVVAIPVGTWAAMRPFSRTDQTITTFALSAGSIPDFWLALVGVLFLAVRWGLVPTSGQSGHGAWVLPIITLALAPAGALVQFVRGAMIEALNSGYVQSARSRGYLPSRLAFRHALRNASVPIVTVVGDRAVHMINGTVIISVVFAWPGVGGVMVDAVLNRDFAVVQAGVFIVGVLVIVLNTLVDVAYAWLDPRIRPS